ncbi:hypothetical protein LEP1GSC190_11050 [Leptospira mayottensis 200901116]|nr:hypothetical protein LEP1GSC190_11050 [Leptospira mayottensis 200901116]
MNRGIIGYPISFVYLNLRMKFSLFTKRYKFRRTYMKKHSTFFSIGKKDLANLRFSCDCRMDMPLW